MKQVFYDKSSAERWQARQGSATTVADHNSMIAFVVSLMDLFARPDIIAPRGAQRLQYLQQPYYGDIKDYKGQMVEVFGTLSPEDLDAFNPLENPTAPKNHWLNLRYLLMQLAAHNYSTRGNAPTGLLDEIKERGPVYIEEPLDGAVIDDLEPATAINEPQAGQELQKLMVILIPYARAFAEDSFAGVTNGFGPRAMEVMGAMGTNSNASVIDALAVVASTQSNIQTTADTTRKVDMVVGGVAFVGAFGGAFLARTIPIKKLKRMLLAPFKGKKKKKEKL